MSDFKKLTVWQRAHQLAIATYSITAKFPSRELFGLTAQLRQATASVSANIAESTGRWALRDQVRFLRIAQGSAREAESHFLLARDVGLLRPEDFHAVEPKIDQVQRMLSALIAARLRGNA